MEHRFKEYIKAPVLLEEKLEDRKCDMCGGYPCHCDADTDEMRDEEFIKNNPI